MYVLSYSVGSFYILRIRFSRLFGGRNSCRCFCVELIKCHPMKRYSVDFVSYSGPSGILGSDGKQNSAQAGARGRENCCTFN